LRLHARLRALLPHLRHHGALHPDPRHCRPGRTLCPCNCQGHSVGIACQPSM
jgi:hypothetical protein